MSKLHIKKHDEVIVLSGKDKGKKGKVLNVNPKEKRVTIEGINFVTIHAKPRRQGDQGGLLKKEAGIDASNIMRICPKCGKPTRIARKVMDNGEKSRYCKNCLELID